MALIMAVALACKSWDSISGMNLNQQQPKLAVRTVAIEGQGQKAISRLALDGISSAVLVSNYQQLSITCSWRSFLNHKFSVLTDKCNNILWWKFCGQEFQFWRDLTFEVNLSKPKNEIPAGKKFVKDGQFWWFINWLFTLAIHDWIFFPILEHFCPFFIQIAQVGLISPRWVSFCPEYNSPLLYSDVTHPILGYVHT